MRKSSDIPADITAHKAPGCQSWALVEPSKIPKIRGWFSFAAPPVYELDVYSSEGFCEGAYAQFNLPPNTQVTATILEADGTKHSIIVPTRPQEGAHSAPSTHRGSLNS